MQALARSQTDLCSQLNQFLTLPEINQTSVNRYWAEVTPSILGPYMMDGFGFPMSAGDFRF